MTECFFQTKKSNTTNILLLPIGQFSPTNAQATLHFEKAFFGLYLPISVHGRVSDIWRGYITQALLHLLNIHTGYLPRPIVVQDRNPHDIQGDFGAEIPLYTKTAALIAFLSDWTENKQKR